MLYRDEFSREGAARASDVWNYTTVKRILKNPVYLGHTLLGKSRKASVKSKKKVPVPRDDWAVTENTHPPLVSEQLYERAQANLGRGSRDYRAYDRVRKSIFSGIAVCAKCGYSLCSCGTVYKGEREKYWYLSCTHQRQDINQSCTGVRVRYADLLEVVRQDLNHLLSMTDDQMEQMVKEALKRFGSEEVLKAKKLQRERAEARLLTIDKMVGKLYLDNAEGRLDDDRLRRVVADLERESAGLKATLAELSAASPAHEVEENYRRFFVLAREYTQIQELNRDILLTFVEKIEVGPKEYPDGTVKPTGNITRAETAAILFRLMDEGSRKTYYSTKSGFRDVATGSWYNTYVATLNNAGVITDSSNGYFRPNEAITRAELAAMLANFTETAGAANYFNDVSARYWAANAIAICAKLGWITGYPDGSFRPDRNVTRAELMAMINRATGRAPKSADAFLPGMKTWSDNTADKWYYLDVQEATNSHSYTVKDSEKWTALNADPNWSLYE